MPQSNLRPANAVPENEQDICLFAQTNFRNQMRRFGIKVDDRRRHMYIIGKTGMGKTTMMENMVLHDIYAGHGVGVVDPHGDFAEKIINFIPPKRINDVVYFNPADIDFPIGFNILEVKSQEQKHLVAAGLMGIFKKIWPDVWSSRMEYILNNTILALLDYPGSTLLGINRLLADKKYRNKVIAKLTDPVVKAFWQNEFASYNDRYAQEAVAPIQNKIGQFLSASVIRNMVAQVTSTINVREIMDSQKIFIMNLSKGRIGEDNSRLLGGMLITELQLSAMERVDIPEAKRKDFFLYVDEFQNFATPSFANILSEARKYRLSLIMAHQYVKQLDEIVADAVFGNVGTLVTFRVGGTDAEVLVKEFTPTFTEEDIVNLAKYQVFMKLMIDGVASSPFSAMTMPPIGSPTASAEKVIKVSRERYAKPRSEIEDKIMRWSGMEVDDEEIDEGTESGDNGVHIKVQRPSEPKQDKKPFSEKPKPIIEKSELPTKTLSLKELIPRPEKKDIPTPSQSVVIPHSPSGESPAPRMIQPSGLPGQPMGEGKGKRKRRRKKKNGQGQGGAPIDGQSPRSFGQQRPTSFAPSASSGIQERPVSSVPSQQTEGQSVKVTPASLPPGEKPAMPPSPQAKAVEPGQIVTFE
ncbi:MAG TPA: type IV secretion system DNA-binding domain-containing protein [Candidatus Kapabacteria bacterium]|nr:type IV secretion system DNA-binding domain-containing protein [Candidatus Kapabacteria bacterium]